MNEFTDTEIMHAGLRILNFVADNPGKVGRLRLARILAGGINEEDVDRGLQFAANGEIDGMTQPQIIASIDGLIGDGQLVKTHGDRPRICLTRRGWAILATIGTFQPAPQRSVVIKRADGVPF